MKFTLVLAPAISGKETAQENGARKITPAKGDHPGARGPGVYTVLSIV